MNVRSRLLYGATAIAVVPTVVATALILLGPGAPLDSLALARAAIIVVAVIATAVAAMVLLVRATFAPLAELLAVTMRAAGGDFAARSSLQTRDEFGELARAVNKVLEDRNATLRKTDTENERLNVSVVTLLQAVFRMSQRDLTAKAPVTDDVVGTLASSVNQFAEETARVLRQVSAVAGKVRAASTSVRTHADKVSQTAAEERAAVQQMIQNLATAITTLNRVAQLADESNNGAEQSTQSTLSALETVNGTLESMESIRVTISETEKRIKRLGERSQEISGIVNLINNIAERTQVLALNASMQAAAAGDAGRGFSVVAEEVQRLAESARQATSHISTLVGNIQAETREAINTVNRTIAQVVAGSEAAQKAGQQMRATQQITFSLVQSVRRIFHSAKAQLEIAEDLRRRVGQIGHSANLTAAAVTEQSRETQTLVQVSEQLVRAVSLFKLQEPRA
jgi:methyl-accepting chemotaxis protein